MTIEIDKSRCQYCYQKLEFTPGQIADFKTIIRFHQPDYLKHKQGYTNICNSCVQVMHSRRHLVISYKIPRHHNYTPVTMDDTVFRLKVYEFVEDNKVNICFSKLGENKIKRKGRRFV
jgi:hypothetical protein